MDQEEPERFESRLVPILREGVDIVKLIFFKELRDHVARLYPERPQRFRNTMAGAVINAYFGIENPDPDFQAFVRRERESIGQVLSGVGEALENLRIPLTDALRITVLCDYQEGRDTSGLLAQAKEAGILLAERDMPMPHTFIDMVRRIGESFGVLTPPAGEQ